MTIGNDSILASVGRVIKTPEDIDFLCNVSKKVLKCCDAVKQGINLAELLSDPKNLKSLAELFGHENLDSGLQTIVQTSLADYTQRSLVLYKDLEPSKLSFLYKAIGGWTQFDTVIAITLPHETLKLKMRLINPRQKTHWQQIGSIPAGSLISVCTKQLGTKRQITQEKLGAERMLALFDTLQYINRDEMASEAARMKAGLAARETKSNVTRLPPRRRNWVSEVSQETTDSEEPIAAFDVVVNKIDTFVHAGNATLIARHLRTFSGVTKMYVIRSEKVKVSGDPDSIWAAEIRNGETMRYEFFGQVAPTSDFLKELAKITNKYTQMDKLG